MNWYALYTKPQCERIVSQRLQVKGFETYLPPASVLEGHPKTGAQSFFPGYLFVRLDLKADPLSSVRWTPGLKHVVRFGERPAVVPNEAIALIRERLAAIEAAGGLPGHRFRPGDRVYIRSGPFADPSTALRRGSGQGSGHRFEAIFEAIFEEALEPAERAWVLIRFLGQINKVQVAVEDLEPVGAAKVTR